MGQDTSEKERYRSGHNGADSKSDGGLRPTWVRIPPSPPFTRVAGKWLIIGMRTRRVRILTYRDVLMPRSAGCARAASLSAIYPRSGEMAHHRHENPKGENPDVQGRTNAAERRMRESGLPLRHLPA